MGAWLLHLQVSNASLNANAHLAVQAGMEQNIRARGGDSCSDFRRDNIGFIFQAYNLIPVLSVEENVEYIMLLQGEPPGVRQKRVGAILTELGLEGYENRRPPQLSGGQQQRVAVAGGVIPRFNSEFGACPAQCQAFLRYYF